MPEEGLCNCQYECPVCLVSHVIRLPAALAEGRSYYPFSYFCLHKYTGRSHDEVHLVGADVITTLYIDKNMIIRGVEASLQDDEGNIMSKEDAQHMITYLTDHIQKLQDMYDELEKKYHDLLNKKGS